MARPIKRNLPIEEQEMALLEKLFIPKLDDNGKLIFERSTEPLTLEETALALWMMDGRKTKKPMTRMGLLYIEQAIMLNIKHELSRYGIKSLDDVIDTHKGRKALATKFDSIDG